MKRYVYSVPPTAGNEHHSPNRSNTAPANAAVLVNSPKISKRGMGSKALKSSPKRRLRKKTRSKSPINLHCFSESILP